MSMMTLKCPKCGAEAKLSLADNDYSGPRRCWKCHEFFTITIHNNQVTSCEPLSKEDYERQQEAKKAAEKSGGGINFSRQGQMEFPQTPEGGTESSKQEDTDIFKILAGKSGGGIDFSRREEPKSPPKTPEKVRDDTKSLSPKAPSSQTEPKKPTPMFPAEKPRDLTNPSSPKAPSKPAEPLKPGATFPPDRIRTFVPMEDIKEQPRDYTKPLNPKKPSSQTEPLKPGDTFPPERYQIFVPQEDIPEKPKKPQKPNSPSE